MKSYTDLEQSKELAKILPLETADMHYVLIDTDEDKYAVGLGKYIGILSHYPCWSLAALLAALPIVDFAMPQLISTSKTLYGCIYNDDLKSHAYDNPVDACYELILKLNELKML